MNEIFTNDQITPIWGSVLDTIKQERNRYIRAYISVENYLSNHTDVVLGGTMGVNLLLGKTREVDDFQYELYTENSFLHANNITNEIAEVYEADTEFPPNIVILKSVIPHKKYQIVVDTRIIAVIFDLSKNSTSVIEPILVDNFEKSLKISVLPPEMQLINLYRTLYTPNNADSWVGSLNDENHLFEIMTETLSNKVGGAAESERSRIQNILLENFIKNNNKIVLIGEHAMHMIDKHFDIATNVIQIISSNSIQDDYATITKIVSTDLPMNYNSRDLHIMQDFRLLRTAIKIGDAQSGNSKEIMYIYNSGNYDLIPYNRFLMGKDFINVGNPFVILRYLLIDFWIIRWIAHNGGIEAQFASKRLDFIRRKVIDLRSMLSGNKLTTIKDEHLEISSGLGVFGENYIGSYENEDISQKTKAKNIQNKYYDYYPQEYKKKNSSYRTL